MRKPQIRDYKTMSAYDKAENEFNEYERKKMMKAVIGVAGGVFAGLVALTVLGGSWYTIDQGERGVVLRNGAFVEVAEPGLHFKMPIIDSVRDVDVRAQVALYQGVQVYTLDQQTATLVVSVNYRVPIDQVADVYENYGSVEALQSRLLDRQVNDEVRNVFGRFNAQNAIRERARLVSEIQTAIQGAVVGPIIIESIQVENIDFDDAYEAAIAARMQAEVEVARVQQNAERERVQAEIVVIQAQAQADSRLAQARAEAESVRLQGEATADAIRARGEALRDNPMLIQLVQAEQWNGQLPTTMIPGQTVPFLDVGGR